MLRGQCDFPEDRRARRLTRASPRVRGSRFAARTCRASRVRAPPGAHSAACDVSASDHATLRRRAREDPAGGLRSAKCFPRPPSILSARARGVASNASAPIECKRGEEGPEEGGVVKLPVSRITSRVHSRLYFDPHGDGRILDLVEPIRPVHLLDLLPQCTEHLLDQGCR